MRLMNQYEFTQQNELNHEFGINIELGETHPVEHPWMKSEEESLDD